MMDDISTKERELNALEKLQKFIPNTGCLIITNSEEAEIEYNGMSVSVIPIWKWLLGKHSRDFMPPANIGG